MENFGQYTLLRRLALGGMAEVFLARPQDDAGQRLVIKRILPNLAEDMHFVEMFLNEARIASQLSHPNIVQLFDLGRSGESLFLSMEYIHGEDLGALIEAVKNLNKLLPPAAALRIAADACLGLQYAHTKKDRLGKPLGLIHRDISPQNIMVTFGGQVKILDFGIARAANQASTTRTGEIKGKYSYISPEQARGMELDARSDVFSLGIVLYELLTGISPLKRENELITLRAAMDCEIEPPTKWASIPKEVEQIVLKALSRDREGRFASAEAFRAAILKLTGENAAASNDTLASIMRVLFFERYCREGNDGTGRGTAFDLPSKDMLAAAIGLRFWKSPRSEDEEDDRELTGEWEISANERSSLPKLDVQALIRTNPFTAAIPSAPMAPSVSESNEASPHRRAADGSSAFPQMALDSADAPKTDVFESASPRRTSVSPMAAEGSQTERAQRGEEEAKKDGAEDEDEGTQITQVTEPGGISLKRRLSDAAAQPSQAPQSPAPETDSDRPREFLLSTPEPAPKERRRSRVVSKLLRNAFHMPPQASSPLLSHTPQPQSADTAADAAQASKQEQKTAAAPGSAAPKVPDKREKSDAQQAPTGQTDSGDGIFAQRTSESTTLIEQIDAPVHFEPDSPPDPIPLRRRTSAPRPLPSRPDAPKSQVPRRTSAPSIIPAPIDSSAEVGQPVPVSAFPIAIRHRSEPKRGRTRRRSASGEKQRLQEETLPPKDADVLGTDESTPGSPAAPSAPSTAPLSSGTLDKASLSGEPLGAENMPVPERQPIPARRKSTNPALAAPSPADSGMSAAPSKTALPAAFSADDSESDDEETETASVSLRPMKLFQDGRPPKAAADAHRTANGNEKSAEAAGGADDVPEISASQIYDLSDAFEVSAPIDLGDDDIEELSVSEIMPLDELLNAQGKNASEKERVGESASGADKSEANGPNAAEAVPFDAKSHGATVRSGEPEEVTNTSTAPGRPKNLNRLRDESEKPEKEEAEPWPPPLSELADEDDSTRATDPGGTRKRQSKINSVLPSLFPPGPLLSVPPESIRPSPASPVGKNSQAPSVRSGPFTVFDQLSEGSSLEDDDLERGTESKTFDAPPKARSSQVPRDADKPTIRPGALKVNAVMDSAPLEEDDNFIDRPTINISEGERPDDLSRPLSRLGQSEFISKVRLRLDRIYDALDMLRKHRGIDKNTLLFCGLIAGFFILVLFLILVL